RAASPSPKTSCRFRVSSSRMILSDIKTRVSAPGPSLAQRDPHRALNGGMTDVFDMQDKTTESVVGVVEPSVRQSEIERSRRKRPESLDTRSRSISIKRLKGALPASRIFRVETGLRPGRPSEKFSSGKRHL